MTFEERFWAKVNKTPGCWIWIGARQSKGYGCIGRDGRILLAHRVSWEMAHGRPVPEGFQILHKCDNPPCVNPAHLLMGTDKVNSIDCCFKGRHRTLHGEESPNAKLTTAQVKRIRRLGKNGWSQDRIAAQFGVSQRNVSGILRREAWDHV